MSDPRQKQVQPQAPSQPHIQTESEHQRREEGLDKTLEDSFPSSDPPSTIPDPEWEDEAA